MANAQLEVCRTVGENSVTNDKLLAGLPVEGNAIRIGKVLVTRKLGEGGMGAVYQGTHTKLNIEVAVKVLPFHLVGANKSAVKRFVREAQSAAAVDHGNLLRVFDVDETAGIHYIVMEFVDGESAEQRLRRERPLPIADALDICIGTGEALTAAHRKNIIHRDIKPANIMIRHEDGRIKVADLGLAKTLTEDSAATGLTATGAVMGTPAYMAPEQATDASKVDVRCDIYSLGATLYSLLTGQQPHEATTLFSLLLKVTQEEPTDAKILRQELSDNLHNVLKTMMAKKPDDRYPTMADAVAAMREARTALQAPAAAALARPQLVTIAEEPPGAAVLPATLDDVTPDLIRAGAGSPPQVSPAPVTAGVTMPQQTVVKSGGGAAIIIAAFLLAAAIGGVGFFYYLANKREAQDGASAVSARGETAAQAEPQEFPSEAGAALEASRTFRKAGMLRKARDKLHEALSLAPADKVLKKELADLETQIADEEKRKAKAEALMETVPSLVEAGRLEEAKAKLVEALALVPQNEQAKRSLESLEWKIGEKKDKETRLAALTNAARSLRDAGQLESARGKLAEALALSPDDPAIKKDLAGLEQEISRKKAVSERATECKRWMDKALEYRIEGDLLKAAETYRRAAGYDTEQAGKARDAANACLFEHYKGEAVAAELSGDLDKAVSSYQKALAAKKDDGLADALKKARERQQQQGADRLRVAEINRWKARAEKALKRGDAKSAVGFYREAEKHGGDFSKEIEQVEAEAAFQQELAAARQLAQGERWSEALDALDALAAKRPNDREVAELRKTVKGKMGAPSELVLDIQGKAVVTMVLIKPGRFVMGSAKGGKDERPAHSITIRKPFYLSATEISQAQYEAATGKNPSRYRGRELPVEQVSWNDVAKFCRILSSIVGRNIRLPTEAEWEYAARAGTTTDFYFGNDLAGFGDYGWYWKNSGEKTQNVGEKKPNAWGLYDMCGNVLEWCADRYGEDYYSKSPKVDPQGPTTGGYRVLRGGSWAKFGGGCKSSAREWTEASARSGEFGFRIAFTAE